MLVNASESKHVWEWLNHFKKLKAVNISVPKVTDHIHNIKHFHYFYNQLVDF